MTTNYTINLVNSSLNSQEFWCFLNAPVVTTGPTIYANSSAHLFVPANSPATNQFVVPLQFKVEAASSNEAVGLNVEVGSYIGQDASIGDVWDATYFTGSDDQGPMLQKDSSSSPPGTISIKTNAYNQQQGDQNNWFASQTFGIETQDGFVGLTWAPPPNDTTIITPQFTFYVATGSYTAGQLADLSSISNDAANIALNQFSPENEVWVELTANGEWSVTNTAPTFKASRARADLDRLTASHLHLSRAHSQLVAYGVHTIGDLSFTDQADKVTSVKWDPVKLDTATGQPIVTGTITVSTAAVLAFTSFICAGITFTASGNSQGTTWSFKYVGTKSVEALKSVLKVGASILFKG